MSYEEMQKMYLQYFSIGRLNADVNTKFALISLVCYITNKIKVKKKDITHYQIIKKICGNNYPESFIKALSVICYDFSFDCTDFPTFGIEDKKIPDKIKEILSNWTPF